MLPFYQSNLNVITILKLRKTPRRRRRRPRALDLEVDGRLRLDEARVAGLLTNRHRRLVEEQLALVVHQPRGISPRCDLKVAARPVVDLIERRIAPEALEPRPSFSLRGNPEQRRLRVRDASVNGLVDVPRLLVISTYSRRLPLMCSLNGLAPQRYTTITSTTSTTSRFFSAFKIIRTPFLRMGPVHGPQLQPF